MRGKTRQQLLTIAAVAIVALLLGDKLILSPLASKWKTNAADIKSLRDQVSQGETLIEREESLRSKWDAMRNDSLATSERSDDQAESIAQDDVLTAVYNWTDASDIQLTSYKTQWKREPRKNYALLEAQAGAYGSVEEIARFVYELESDDLPIKIDELELTSRDDTGDQIAVSLRLSALRLTE